MTSALTLAIDVGTGSVRAALVDANGRIVTIAAREHDQIVPRFGWAEQRPTAWWEGVVATIRGGFWPSTKAEAPVPPIGPTPE